MNSSHLLIEDIIDGMHSYSYYNHPQTHTGEIYGYYNYGVIYGLYEGEYLRQSGYEYNYEKLVEGQSEKFARGVVLGITIMKSVENA